MKDNFIRAARSTTRNIAEGFGRFSFKENIHFCRIARGSLYELIDDTITMHEENQLNDNAYRIGREKINHALKVLNGYIAYLQKQTQ
jgi:four helix bundle protein